MALMEDMIRTVFKEVLNVALPNPFPRMTYAEAMSRFGSDKPDLRVTLELTEVTDAVKDVRVQGVQRPRQFARWSCGGVARARRRRVHAR